MGVFGLGLMPDEVRAQLAPGEQALAYENATQLAGASGIRPAGPPRADVGWSWNPFVGGLTVNPDWIGAGLGGVNSGGAAGSLADQFSQHLERGTHILITDQRFGVVGNVAGVLSTPDLRITWAVPRGTLVAVEPAPRLLQRGRLRLTFVDGSWAMAMLGMFVRRASRRFLAASGVPAV